MRELFTIDLKDYDPNAPVRKRPSARAIILNKDVIALIYASNKGYFKFPGGGIKGDESPIDALIRETREESGMEVIPESISEFGIVNRRQKSSKEDYIFEQTNYYYLCDVTEKIGAQNLDDYELEDGFELRFVDVRTAINTNKEFSDHFDVTGDLFDKVMSDRERKVLEIILEELT